MQKIGSLLVLLCLSLIAVQGQKLENSTLLKIEGNGLEKSYFMSFNSIGFYPRISKKITSCKTNVYMG